MHTLDLCFLVSSKLYTAYPHSRACSSCSILLSSQFAAKIIFDTRLSHKYGACICGTSRSACCLCCVPMRLHVSIHRYLSMYAVLSTDQSKNGREHGRTHKLPVHSSGLSINAALFTANIIEQQQQRVLSCSPTQEGSGRRAGVADPAAYAQIVGT